MLYLIDIDADAHHAAVGAVKVCDHTRHLALANPHIVWPLDTRVLNACITAALRRYKET